MFDDYFNTVPDAINEIGTKFWLDKFMTKYCHDKLGKDFVSYVLETKEGYRTRLLINKQEQIYENQNYEAFSCHIDILSLCRDHGKTNNRNSEK